MNIFEETEYAFAIQCASEGEAAANSAVTAHLRDATRARKRRAYTDALASVDAALRLVSATPAADRFVEAVVLRANVLREAKRPAEAEASLKSLLAQCEKEPGRRAMLALVLLTLAETLDAMNQWGAAKPLLVRAAELAERDDVTDDVKIRVFGVAAHRFYRQALIEQTERYLRAFLGLHERHATSPTLRAHPRTRLAEVLRRRAEGYLEKHTREAALAAKHAEALRLLGEEPSTQEWPLARAKDLARPLLEEAAAILRTAEGELPAPRDPFVVAKFALERGRILSLQDTDAEATRELGRALELFDAVGADAAWLGRWTLGYTADAHERSGNPEGVRASLAEAIRRAEGAKERGEVLSLKRRLRKFEQGAR